MGKAGRGKEGLKKKKERKPLLSINFKFKSTIEEWLKIHLIKITKKQADDLLNPRWVSKLYFGV